MHAVAAVSIDPGEYEVNYLAQAHWYGSRYNFGSLVSLGKWLVTNQGRVDFFSDGRYHEADFGCPGRAKVRTEGSSMPLHSQNWDGEFWTMMYRSSKIHADVVIGGLIS